MAQQPVEGVLHRALRGQYGGKARKLRVRKVGPVFDRHVRVHALLPDYFICAAVRFFTITLTCKTVLPNWSVSSSLRGKRLPDGIGKPLTLVTRRPVSAMPRPCLSTQTRAKRLT